MGRGGLESIAAKKRISLVFLKRKNRRKKKPQFGKGG